MVFEDADNALFHVEAVASCQSRLIDLSCWLSSLPVLVEVGPQCGEFNTIFLLPSCSSGMVDSVVLVTRSSLVVALWFSVLLSSLEEISVSVWIFCSVLLNSLLNSRLVVVLLLCWCMSLMMHVVMLLQS